MHRREFISKMAISALGSFLCIGSCATLKRKPNFVFILVDDLGWMDLGCQGSSFYETPNIDRLAEQGMRFTQAYSACPVCSPTRAALLTGKDTARLQFTGHITRHKRHRHPDNSRIIPPDDRMYIRPAEITIAEALKPAGYASASIGKWHVGHEPKYWPTEQGFDINIAGYTHGSPPTYWSPYENPEKDWNADIPTLKDGKKGEYLTDRLTDEAISFIQENRKRPFLLYLSHYAVHTPLEAPLDVVEKYKRKLQSDSSQKNAVYAAMIENLDQNVGRLLTSLQDLDLTQDTVVIFASDNGGLSKVTNNAPLRAGKGYLYEGGIRVPMIVKWPGHVRPGSVCGIPVTSEDIYPTMMEISGQDYLSNNLDGKSILPLLLQTEHWKERDLYWYYPHYSPQAQNPGAVIRSGKWKLIQRYDPVGLELYDLENDLSEQCDLAKQKSHLAQELQTKLVNWIESIDTKMHTINPNYNK